MSTTTTSISLPKICCRCAQKKGNHSWTITSSQLRVTGYYVVAYTTRTTTVSFDVSVCDSCYQELSNIDDKSTLLIVASILLGSIIMPIWIGDSNLGLLLIISGGCGGWFIGYITSLIYKKNSGYNLISFDSKQIIFTNNEYQRQFAIFNPKITEPPRNKYGKQSTESEYGIDVIICPNCKTVNSSVVINCRICQKDLSKESKTSNPYV